MDWQTVRVRAGLALLVGYAAALFLHAPALDAQTVSQQDFDTGLLWKVEGSGIPASYIFGTIHIDDKRVTDLPDVVLRSLEQSKSFTMEVELDPDALLQLATRMVYSDGRNLESVIGVPLYRRVIDASGGLGLPPEVLRMFKPWVVALMLVVPPQTTGEVLDLKLYGIALRDKKIIHQLESVDEQVATLEQLPESDQIAMLTQALDNRDRMPRVTRQLVEAYLRRDLAAMWRINEESDADMPDYKAANERFTRRLLDDRNRRMVDRMQPQLRAGTFIAVGALHLYGEHGLLNLLSQRGYRLERIY